MLYYGLVQICHMPCLRQILFLICIILTSALAGKAQEQQSVRSLSFSGNSVFSASELEAQMNTRPKTFLERMTFWKPAPVFSPFVLEDDISRLRSHYMRNGYPSAVINYHTTAIAKGRKLKITVEISEGRPVLTGTVDWQMPLNAEERKLLEDVQGRLQLKPGKVLRDQEVYADESTVLRSFMDGGYPLARINRNLTLSADTSSAGLAFRIQPGPRSWFGNVSLSGDSLVPKSYILQQVTIKPGELFSAKTMNTTQKRLSSLDLFRFVTIRANTDSIENNQVPVAIRVSELPRWTVKAGAGYGAEDRLRLSAHITRRNFMGGARKLILEARHSYFDPVSLDLRFIQPNFPLYRVDLAVNPYFHIERERSYEVLRAGVGVTFLHSFGSRSSAWLTWNSERSILSDLTPEKSLREEDGYSRRNFKSGLTLGTSIDKANDIFDPTRGWKFTGFVSAAGVGLKSDYHYYKMSADVSRYFQPAPRLTLATRLKAGVISPYGERKVSPVEDRFLIGGASSLRGWARNAVSPVDSYGNQTGGESMLEGSAELRFPLYEIIGGALFVDAGNVWRDPFVYKLNELKYNAGLGIRIRTPIGPGRIDLAFPISEDRVKPMLFITIGHAY